MVLILIKQIHLRHKECVICEIGNRNTEKTDRFPFLPVIIK